MDTAIPIPVNATVERIASSPNEGKLLNCISIKGAVFDQVFSSNTMLQTMQRSGVPADRADTDCRYGITM